MQLFESLWTSKPLNLSRATLGLGIAEGVWIQWNGMVDWNGGMDWTGMVDWNGMVLR